MDGILILHDLFVWLLGLVLRGTIYLTLTNELGV